MQTSHRIDLLDAAKGIGIVFVFLGHLLVYGSGAFSYIFSFHMPLFFLLAGVVYRVDEIKDVRGLAKKIYNGIVLPGLIFTIIGLLLFAVRLESPFPADCVRWDQFYVRIVNECGAGGISAWFLGCLAGAKIAYWFIRRIPSHRLQLILLVVCFFAGNECAHLPTKLVWGAPCKLFSVPMAVFYLGLGYELRRVMLQLGELRRIHGGVPLLALSIGCFLVVWLCQTGETPNMAFPTSVNPGFFLVASLAGTAGVLLLAQVVRCRPVCFIGRYSLYFFLLEGHVREFILRGLKSLNPAWTVRPMEDELSIGLITFLILFHLAIQGVAIGPLKRAVDAAKRRFSI